MKQCNIGQMENLDLKKNFCPLNVYFKMREIKKPLKKYVSGFIDNCVRELYCGRKHEI